MPYQVSFHETDGDKFFDWVEDARGPEFGKHTVRKAWPAREEGVEKTPEETVAWVFRKLMARPGALYISNGQGHDFKNPGRPITKPEAVEILRETHYLYLVVEISGEGSLSCAAHAEYVPSKWMTRLSWAAAVWPIYLGFVPAVFIAICVYGLGGKFGDGSGNESGLAHFMGMAWVIGLVLFGIVVLALLVGLGVLIWGH
jgi:hypothetical protein